MLKPTQHLPVLLFAFLAAACGTTIGPSGNQNNSDAQEGNDYSIADYAREFPEAICTRQVACGRYPDVATCLDSQDLTIDQFTADVEAGLILFDLEQGRMCLVAIKNSKTCSDALDPAVTQACDDTSGTVSPGGACFSGLVCAGDAYCRGADKSSCSRGSCISVRQEGETCGDIIDVCALGLSCDFTDSRCRPLAAVGENCPNDNCVGGTYCDQDAYCVRTPTTGESCNPNVGCLKGTDYCDDQNRCVALLDIGDSCEPFSSFTCVAFAGCIEGVCVGDAQLGEACTPEVRCIGDTSCNGSICVAEEVLGVCQL